ncbi:MAG: Radical domain protein, partial [candidate division NC10 bacterium]|nr:Radical domain protein [candidate division NC10 bacterium]
MSDNGTLRVAPSPQDLATNGPLKGRLHVVKQALLEGGPGFCQFAINNACNAGCDFCNFNLDKLPR